MSSRFILLGVVASASLVVASGCSSSSSDQPGLASQPQSGPAWTLNLKATCVDAAQDQCVAKYGFSVSADGTYQVGPGPQGQVRKGFVTASELAPLKTQVEASAHAEAANGENREENFAHVANDTVSFSRSGSLARVLARNEGSVFFFTVQSTEAAHSLHAAIRNLANSYYRLPFGNECGNAVDKFSTAAAGMQSCERDSDCAYVRDDRGFSVIPPSGSESVLSESCYAIKPILVANSQAIIAGAQVLSDLTVEAQNVCGGEFALNNFGATNLGGEWCQAQQQITTIPATCQQNVCKAHLQ